jgi:hypothetical protein
MYELRLEFLPTGLDENRAIRKDNGWNTSKSMVDSCDEFGGFFVALKPNAQVLDLICFKEFLSPYAVGTILCSVQDDLGRSEGIVV